ncbi:unnamed protein product, partial [Ranitomeya imitator]
DQVDTLTFQNHSLRDRAKMFEEALMKSTNEQLEVTRVNIGLLSAALRLVTRCLPWLPGDLGIVGHWRAVCVTALQRPHSDAAAIGIVVYIAAASLNVTIALAPYRHLDDDLISIKHVLEMKNQLIHEQEKRIMELEKLAEINVVLEERIQVLQQQNEDMRARIDQNVAVTSVYTCFSLVELMCSRTQVLVNACVHIDSNALFCRKPCAINRMRFQAANYYMLHFRAKQQTTKRRMRRQMRQLSVENANLQESVEKESKEKKRLSRTNEELVWKLQSADSMSPINDSKKRSWTCPKMYNTRFTLQHLISGSVHVLSKTENRISYIFVIFLRCVLRSDASYSPKTWYFKTGTACYILTFTLGSQQQSGV